MEYAPVWNVTGTTGAADLVRPQSLVAFFVYSISVRLHDPRMTVIGKAQEGLGFDCIANSHGTSFLFFSGGVQRLPEAVRWNEGLDVCLLIAQEGTTELRLGKAHHRRPSLPE